MAVFRYKRFAKLQVLKCIRRDLVERFFGQFNGAMSKVGLPPGSASDEEYFEGVARVLMSPEGLPDEVSEALYLVDEMSGPEAQERLLGAARKAGVALSEGQERTGAELALEVFLAAPRLLDLAHSEQKLTRMVSLEYFCTDRPVEPGKSFEVPGPEVLAGLARDLDEWFARHDRGRGTARVDVHAMDGEYFFIIRHGDRFTRTPKVSEQRTEILHFRPERDDVFVVCPRLGEVRIWAGTKGERELYRRVFGLRLFGEAEYFCRRKAFTLEPLRALGRDALDVTGCGDLVRAVLRGYELALDNAFDEVMEHRATDVFAAAEARGGSEPAIPPGGTLVRAVFDLYFAGRKKPRRVQVRLPNTLKVGRQCDVRSIQMWLSKQGFRAVEGGELRVESPKKRGWKLLMGEKVIAEGR